MLFFIFNLFFKSKNECFFHLLFSKLVPENVLITVTSIPNHAPTTKEPSDEARKRIENRIKSKEFETKKRLYSSKISSIWKFYEEIFDEKGHKIQNFIFCPHCETVKTYDTSLGSSNLIRHTKRCKGLQSNTLDRYVVKNVQITKNDRNEVLDAAKRFCYVDLRPFYAIAGEGLVDLLMAVSSVTARHGLLSKDNILDLLPHPTTVSLFS